MSQRNRMCTLLGYLPFILGFDSGNKFERKSCFIPFWSTVVDMSLRVLISSEIGRKLWFKTRKDMVSQVVWVPSLLFLYLFLSFFFVSFYLSVFIFMENLRWMWGPKDLLFVSLFMMFHTLVRKFLCDWTSGYLIEIGVVRRRRLIC